MQLWLNIKITLLFPTYLFTVNIHKKIMFFGSLGGNIEK